MAGAILSSYDWTKEPWRVSRSEAHGLFLKKAWAEVLAAPSGAIYVPLEIAELARKPTWHGRIPLALNLAIVRIMIGALITRRQRDAQDAG